MSRKLCCVVGLAAALALACGVPSFGAKPPKPSYLIRQLDLVDQSGVEYVSSGAGDVNDPVETDGPYQAVGMVFTASKEGFPACWTISTVGGQLQSDLKLLNRQPLSNAASSGINQLGEIVGEGTTGAGQMVGLYWANSNEATVPQPLPILSNYDRSRAFGINNNGVICGCCERDVIGDDGQSHRRIPAGALARQRGRRGGRTVRTPHFRNRLRRRDQRQQCRQLRKGGGIVVHG